MTADVGVYLVTDPVLCDRHGLVIGDLGKRRSTGKTIARVAHGDALAADAVYL